jgi:hypothetical protein
VDDRSAYEAIIFAVVTDPEPQNSTLDVDAKGAMVKADSTRPEPVHALELKGGVPRIILEKAVLLVRQALNRWSQVPVMRPELWRGEMPQNSVDLPAA